MSMRNDYYEQIIAIQHIIDLHSELWCKHHCIHNYAEYTYWVNELVKLKQAIIQYEQLNGWNS